MTEFNLDVLILGSGPAGNTAAIYLARNNVKMALVSGMSIGGQLTTTTEVENYPGFPSPILGMDLMQNMMDQARNLGVEIIYDQVISVDFSSRPYKCMMDGGDVYFANYLIIATGATAKWLGLPSEEEFKGRGVSACATCDGSFYKGRDVAVVGGGSSAGTEALHLSHICRKVYLIHRKDTFRMAEGILKKITEVPNIEFIMDSTVVEVLGTENPKAVDRLKIKNLKNNSISELAVSGMFVAIGKNPATEMFKDSPLHLDDYGYIVTCTDSARTNIPGVYAIGDVANKKFKQGVIAAGYGAIAALEVQEDMEK